MPQNASSNDANKNDDNSVGKNQVDISNVNKPNDEIYEKSLVMNQNSVETATKLIQKENSINTPEVRTNKSIEQMDISECNSKMPQENKKENNTQKPSEELCDAPENRFKLRQSILTNIVNTNEEPQMETEIEDIQTNEEKTEHENLFLLGDCNPVDSIQMPEITVVDKMVRDSRKSCIVIDSSMDSCESSTDCIIIDMSAQNERTQTNITLTNLNLTNLKLNESKDIRTKNSENVIQHIEETAEQRQKENIEPENEEEK